MKSHEALSRAIGKDSIEHARKLGLSTGLIYKWQEPSTDWTDSGAYNPLDRIETVIETSLHLGSQPDDAYAPIQYLAEKFNLIVIPIPQVPGSASELGQALLKTVKEFGDLAREASIALADGTITPEEGRRIEKEGWELIRQTTVFLTKTKEHVGPLRVVSAQRRKG